MRKVWAGLLGALVGLSLAAWASRVGLGLGMCEWGFGGGELWAEFWPEASLALRLGLTYLVPVLPGEAPAVGFLAGARLALGEGLRPYLVALAGGWVERPVVGPALWGWSAGGTAGLEWSLDHGGLYVAASALVALRSTPHGTLFYPYFLYIVGVSWGQ